MSLGWDLAIARYQPRPCGQQRGFAPTFFWKIFGKSIFSEIFLVNFFWKIFLLKIFLASIFCSKKIRENMFLKTIFGENILTKIFLAKMFGVNIFGKNIFSKNIFGINIFFSYPCPIWLPYKQHLFSAPHQWFLKLSVTNETKQTYGPDGAMFVPFIITDILFFIKVFGIIYFGNIFVKNLYLIQ